MPNSDMDFHKKGQGMRYVFPGDAAKLLSGSAACLVPSGSYAQFSTGNELTLPTPQGLAPPPLPHFPQEQNFPQISCGNT